jgi:hypothetical protein
MNECIHDISVTLQFKLHSYKQYNNALICALLFYNFYSFALTPYASSQYFLIFVHFLLNALWLVYWHLFKPFPLWEYFFI